MQSVTNKIYGLICTVIIAIISLYLQDLPFWPFTLKSGVHPLEEVMIALILGMIISSIVKLPEVLKPGIKFSSKTILNISIILLGAKLSIHSIMSESYKVIIMIILCVLFAFFISLLVCKIAKIESKLAILIAVGTAICGGSAIAVAAPIIKAKENDIGLSIAVVNVLGLFAIFIFPILCTFFNFSSNSAGVWMGLSIQAVVQAVAAGFSYSSAAGSAAVIVKLARVLTLAPMMVLISIWYGAKNKGKDNRSKTSWTSYVPPFILLFILLIILNSFGVVQDLHAKKVISNLSMFFMTMALAGIGLSTNLKKVLKGGFKTFWISFVCSILLALFAFLLVYFWI